MTIRKRKTILRHVADFLDSVPELLRKINKRILIFTLAGLGVAGAVIAAILIFSGGASATEVVSVDDVVPTSTTTYSVPTQTPTPIPTTTPVVTADPTLQSGDENEKVQQLQERLMDLGFLDIDETTQLFGPATKQAVEWFQRQMNLEQTGIADPVTLDLLYSSDAKHYTLLKGTEGEDVNSLQRRLEDLGYLDKVTSYYGTETEDAVKKFQKANNLSADGKTGEVTLDLIYSPDAKATPEKQKEYRSVNNISEVIAAAKSVKGKPYVSGAEGPSKFDCSGLVYWCLHQAGSNIGRYNAQGYSAVKRWDIVCEGKMDFNKLQKGDLLFFHVPSRNKEIGHVAIYIGNGYIIDASSSNGKVVERKCTTKWFVTNFRLARRPYGAA